MIVQNLRCSAAFLKAIITLMDRINEKLTISMIIHRHRGKLAISPVDAGASSHLHSVHHLLAKKCGDAKIAAQSSKLETSHLWLDA